MNRVIHFIFVCLVFVYAVCWSFPAGAQEEEPKAVLILQLFFPDSTQVRGEMPMSSIQECVEHIPEMLLIRSHRGKDVAAVAAGCFVRVEDKPA